MMSSEQPRGPIGGSVHDATDVARVRRFFDCGFSSQMTGQGFSFVEIPTLCPTGWFLPTAQGPSYLDEELGAVHEVGEIEKDGGVDRAHPVVIDATNSTQRNALQ